MRTIFPILLKLRAVTLFNSSQSDRCLHGDGYFKYLLIYGAYMAAYNFVPIPNDNFFTVLSTIVAFCINYTSSISLCDPKVEQLLAGLSPNLRES